MHCDTAEIYDDLRQLLEDIAYGREQGLLEADRLKELLDTWDNIDCPDGGCKPAMCTFAKPIDWVEFHGYRCFRDLIEDLDQSKPITKLPTKPGFEVMRATWAKRPGHYNP